METLRILEARAIEEIEIMRMIFDQVWGLGGADSAPSMVIQSRYGGMCLLAYDGDRPIGASYGFLAKLDGEVVLWSHSTAALVQDHGVGGALKLHQRELASRRGLETIAWTFDPLVPRNAYFNLVKLGVEVVDFVEDLYGALRAPSGEVHASDRFVVRQRVDGGSRSLTVFDRVPPGARSWPEGDGARSWPEGDGDDRGLTYCRIDDSRGDIRGAGPRQTLRYLMSMGCPLVGIVVQRGKVTGYVFGEARELT
ncbi:MAG: hypothetical protein ACP5PJ_00095 [Acidimicrobiales bacterium]